MSAASTTWIQWLSQHHAAELLPLPPSVANQTWDPSPQDRAAAWELYTELRTRITAQPLHYMHGDEETALKSVADLFQMSRDMIRKAGPQARHFATLTTFALNRVIRPFTAEWHKKKCEGKLANEDHRHEFRGDLIRVQGKLQTFATILGALAEGDAFRDGSQSWPTDPEQIGRVQPPPARPTPIGGDIPFDIAFDEFVDAGQAAAIRWHEHYEIRRRRNPNLPAQAPAVQPALPRPNTAERVKNVAGLALSGGGIRSATFALGVIQRLTAAGVLDKFDYLSTVSGGGYLGSFLSTYLNTASPEVALVSGKLPFREPDVGESAPLRHLRGHSKYLISGGLLNRMNMILLAVYGVCTTVLIFWPLLGGSLLLVELGQGNEVRNVAHGGPFKIGPFLRQLHVWLPFLVCCVLPLLSLAPASLICRQYRKEKELIRWQQVVACIIAFGFLVTAWNLIPPLFRGVALLFESPKWRHWIPSAAAVSGAVATLQRLWANLDSAPASPKVKRLIAMTIMALTGPTFGVLLFLLLGHFLIAGDSEAADANAPHTGLLWCLTLLPLAFDFLCLDINQSSLHPFYRRKLSEAYLIAHADSRKSAGDVRADDGIKLSELRSKNPGAPYHLINCALEAPASRDAAVRGRGTDFFLFTQKYSGSSATGYRETTEWEKEDARLNLGTAMAISAAAASPFMGVGSIPGGNFLLTLFNIRLDYWLAVPGRRKLPWWLWRAGPIYLLRQGFGFMDETTEFVDVSDGGHIENLAIYELLRRRSKFIVAVDGECDPDIRCGSLMQLIRYALIDFGVQIDIDISRFKKNSDGNVPFHFALATVDYPELNHDSPKATGYLLYVKLSCTGNEPPHVTYYRSQHAEFPHESTADQFFDEDQFEAYRALGEHAAGDMFSSELLGHETTPASLAAWFRATSAALEDPNNK